jgi:hypothetical protein
MRYGARWLHLHHDQQGSWRPLHWRYRQSRRTGASGTGSTFCKKYGLTCLVLVEPHDDMTLAIAREKALKA